MNKHRDKCPNLILTGNLRTLAVIIRYLFHIVFESVLTDYNIIIPVYPEIPTQDITLSALIISLRCHSIYSPVFLAYTDP